MRFLKTQNTNKFSISDNSLIVYPKGPGPGNRIVTDATGGFLLPKGTTSQRPQTSSVRTPTNAHGMIRYNTSTNSVEAYVNGVWQTIAAPASVAITKQTVGTGNSIDTDFGPLTPVATGTSYQASADNILVFIENVFQISTTNYTIVPNYLGVSGDYGISFGTPVPSGKAITVYYGFV